MRPVTLPVDLGPPRVKLDPSHQLSMHPSPSPCLSHQTQSAECREGLGPPAPEVEGPAAGGEQVVDDLVVHLAVAAPHLKLLVLLLVLRRQAGVSTPDKRWTGKPSSSHAGARLELRLLGRMLGRPAPGMLVG